MPNYGGYVVATIGGFDDEERDVPVGWCPTLDQAERIAAELDRRWTSHRSPTGAGEAQKSGKSRATKAASKPRPDLIAAALHETRIGGGHIVQGTRDVIGVRAASVGFAGATEPLTDPAPWDRAIERADAGSDGSLDSILRAWFRRDYPSLPMPYSPIETTATAVRPKRHSYFAASTDPRVVTCEAWKCLMQFREELLTNPRRDSGEDGWWSAWIETVCRWLYGGGDWGAGYYPPSYRDTTTGAAVCLTNVHQRRNVSALSGDEHRSMLFPANSTYLFDGVVIDWSTPFPAIDERGPIVEWLESWIDWITRIETVDRSPTDDLNRVATVAAERAAEQAVRAIGASEGNAGKGDAKRAKLPTLKPHELQAWRLVYLYGLTQDKAADALNRELGTNYSQGQVSRFIKRVNEHPGGRGIAEKLPGPIERPRTVDPGRLELGARVDKRKPRPSDMSRANDDNE